MPLSEDVHRALTPIPAGKTLYVAIGNRLRGDDAAGPEICSRARSPSDAVRILDVGERSEDAVEDAIGFSPGKTVFLDAANFGGAIGEARVVPFDEIPETALSTHAVPPKAAAKIIMLDSGCEFSFVGIQIRQVGFGSPMSPEVEATVDEIAAILSEGR